MSEHEMSEHEMSQHERPPDDRHVVADPHDDAVIVATGLSKRFDTVDVVHDLDLVIEPGTIVGLIGPSGCGKTTTVRLLTGLLRPTAGETTLDGVPPTDLSAAERSRIGYLPQIPALFEDLSLWENLSFHASMYGLPLRRRNTLRGLLDWVELGDDRRKRVRDVSGGMQRRLALAATFVHSPRYLFLDEPTAGIDPILREKFWRRFRELRDAGSTFLVTTQYVGEAAYCDLVGLLSDGELLFLDTPENLRRAAFHGEVIDVETAMPISMPQLDEVRHLPFVVGDVDQLDTNVIRVVVDDAAHALTEISSCLATLGVDVVDSEEYDVGYDEAFVRIVERFRNERDDIDRGAA
jgi:ABC-2 type transport system ATP-binding protein